MQPSDRPGDRAVVSGQQPGEQPALQVEQKRYNAGYDERPQFYDDLRAQGHMARRRAAYFERVLDEVPGRVLELGSGTGTLLRQLAAARPDRTFTGVEPLPNYVEFANVVAHDAGATNVSFAVGTGEHLPAAVADASVGLVMSVDALHHVDDLDAVVAEAARVAAPGARWRAMEPNRLHPYVYAWHALTPGERPFPVGDFLRRASAAGWHLAGRDRLYIFPSGVRRVPRWAERAELLLEKVPPLSGGVVLDLVRR